MSVLGLVAAFAVQTMTAPDDPRWVPAGANAQGAYAIDPGSFSRRGDRVRVFVRIRLAQPGAHGVRVGVTRYDYDCGANTVRPEMFDFYDDEGFLTSAETPEDQLVDEPIEANSPNADVIGRVCPVR